MFYIDATQQSVCQYTFRYFCVQVGVQSNQTSDDVRQSRLADKIYKRVKIKVKIIRILYLHVKVTFLISDMVSDA